jgi:hypothetical protein
MAGTASKRAVRIVAKAVYNFIMSKELMVVAVDM